MDILICGITFLQVFFARILAFEWMASAERDRRHPPRMTNFIWRRIGDGPMADIEALERDLAETAGDTAGLANGKR